jgi:hypothetical protein
MDHPSSNGEWKSTEGDIAMCKPTAGQIPDAIRFCGKY